VILGCAKNSNKLLADRELLAIVAGNALNENIVNEIDSRGLAFHPLDVYRGQLTTAGADARVLTALNKAKVIVITGNAEKHSSSAFLDHLAAAGNLIRAKQYQQASQELDSAQKSGGGPEASFVMGELFREQEEWAKAASAYEEVLQENPNFTEAHTKLSYLIYRLGDPEEALRQPKLPSLGLRTTPKRIRTRA
jgi:tetratricopeptide (TPR) repeat protein